MVYSRKGNATFSARVIEPNRAPDWKRTPIPVRTSCISLSPAVPISTPLTMIFPAPGDLRPIRSLSRVDLPQPLPPRMTKISPLSTWKLSPSKISSSPYPAVRSSTMMTGSWEEIAVMG